MALGFLATTARSDVLTLSLPADLVSGLVGALDHLRSTAAADLREALDDLGEALAAGGPVTARRDLLGELLAVAIDEVGDRISLHTTRLLRGEGSADEVRAAVAQLSGLLELLARVEAGA